MNATQNIALDQVAANAVPAEFELMDPYGPFDELVGPFYATVRDDRTVVGMRVTEKHRNKGTIMHGGMFLTLADTAMIKACARVRPEGSMCVTTSMSSEFLAAGRPGDWIEAEVETLRNGRRMIVMNCMIRRNGPERELLMRASAIFQVVQR